MSSPTLQETLDRFHQFQDSFGFSLSKLFVYDVSQEKLKVMSSKDICPNFFDGADLRFQTQ